MRLIDADRFLSQIEGQYMEHDISREKYMDLEDRIMQQPTIEQEPHWIPCSERLPEDMEEVNVTWVNHNPESYYNFIKDKPFTATAVYYKEKWYWYTSTCVDLLAEYGRNPNQEIDDDIEITAWMPLPEPYKPDDFSQHMNPPED